jgi:hypothetical protein
MGMGMGGEAAGSACSCGAHRPQPHTYIHASSTIYFQVHRCNPGEIPQHRPYSRPEYNGCGTYELKVNLATNDMEQCCNMHDLCYGSCGRTKDECDEMFLECMVHQCIATHPDAASRAYKRCLREARLYFNGVFGFGCFAYKRAQQKHCECRPAATYFDAREHDLQASLRRMWARAAPVNRTGTNKWDEFL